MLRDWFDSKWGAVLVEQQERRHAERLGVEVEALPAIYAGAEASARRAVSVGGLAAGELAAGIFLFLVLWVIVSFMSGLRRLFS